MKNERTSKRVGKVAGRILQIFEQFEIPASDEVYVADNIKIGTAGDIKALAASALTQTPDQKPAKKKGGRR